MLYSILYVCVSPVLWAAKVGQEAAVQPHKGEKEEKEMEKGGGKEEKKEDRERDRRVAENLEEGTHEKVLELGVRKKEEGNEEEQTEVQRGRSWGNQ